ncbi:hypothetical protein V2I01_35020 [Micromonospora sp. BRA006-A]|nr:hypothetical protein [Micromonospora sp. BRA006-A]
MAGLLADPAIRVVTLTVTEKAYRLDPVTAALTVDADLTADLTTGRPRVPCRVCWSPRAARPRRRRRRADRAGELRQPARQRAAAARAGRAVPRSRWPGYRTRQPNGCSRR